MNEIESYMEEFTADFTNDDIVDYPCTDIQLRKLIAREDSRAVDLQTQIYPCVASLERYVESSKRKLVVGLANRRTCAAALPSALTGLRGGFEHADLYVGSPSQMFPRVFLIPILIPFLPPPP